jgi:hypothetical protein
MPLRPELYDALKRVFRHVEIANEGEEMQRRFMQVDGHSELVIDSRGEYYRVSCPFCSDTRKRLWINHRWGLWDPQTQSRNLWLAVCWNEQCMRDKIRRNDLYRDVFDPMFNHEHDELLRGDIVAKPSREAFWPGPMTEIHRLPSDHLAARYLTSRNFDLPQLYEDFKISYCFEAGSDVYHATNRIIIPVFLDGKLNGWQARYIGTPQSKSVPKYFSMPGWKKGQCLYNYDNAIRYNHVVICEGPTDTWRYGKEAVCLFGKVPSHRQLELLGKWDIQIIMLDGDAQDDAEKMRMSLSGLHPSATQIVVNLPNGVDPGAMDANLLRMTVAMIAFNHRVNLAAR